MKKLILLLLFIPLVSFGQNYLGALENLYNREFDNGIESVFNYGVYDKNQSIIKATLNYEEETFGITFTKEEMSFKGAYDSYPIIDGWYKTYEKVQERKNFIYAPDYHKYFKKVRADRESLLCTKSFFICNYEVYQNKNYSDSNCFGVYDSNFSTPLFRVWNSLLVVDEIEEYDLELMVNVFLDDLINNNAQMGYPVDLITSFGDIGASKDSSKRPKIKAIFEPLEGNTLALAYGMNDDDNIILKIDPENWAKASTVKRWYTLYHELGHDVLNFEHGQGGKMMFNFADRDYNWETFEKDRNYMFKKYLNN